MAHPSQKMIWICIGTPVILLGIFGQYLVLDPKGGIYAVTDTVYLEYLCADNKHAWNQYLSALLKEITNIPLNLHHLGELA